MTPSPTAVPDPRSRADSGPASQPVTTVERSAGSLSPAECDEVAAVLADAFTDDPWAVHVTGHRRRGLRHVLRVPVVVSAAHGGVVRCRDAGGALLGAAVWTPGHRPGTGPADAWRSGALALPLHLGPRGSVRALREEAAQHAVLDPLLSPADAHLWVLGVRRDRHGRGLGRALVAGVTADAAARGYGRLVLNTDNPANVAVYEAMGLRLLTTSRRPSGLTSHVLARALGALAGD